MNPAPRTTPRVAARITSLSYADSFVPEVDQASQARESAADLGITPVSRGVSACLTFLAAALHAKAVVEVGTGAGVSGLALLSGMADEGILTSVDAENEHQMAARRVFAAAGIPTRRARLIAGSALTVLPKLSDGAYDLVFVDGDPLEYVEYVAQAQRLLRSGGILVLHHVLWNDTVADPDDEGDETVIMREALQAVLDIDDFRPVLLPIGDGVLAAVKA